MTKLEKVGLAIFISCANVCFTNTDELTASITFILLLLSYLLFFMGDNIEKAMKK